MICPECNGTGKTVYFVEVGRDKNGVTYEKREGICRRCNGSGEKPMTNGDKIRAMSDEKLAEFIGRAKEPCDYCQLAVVAGSFTETLCDDAMLKWLQQSAEDE